MMQLDQLLADVTSGNASEAFARANRLRAQPADPRIASAVVAWLRALKYHATSAQPFWREAFALLETSADTRVLDELPALRAHIGATIKAPPCARGR
jgi:hypothetical protein